MKAIMILLSLAANLLSLYASVRTIRLLLNHKQVINTKKKYLLYGTVWLCNWLIHFFFTNSMLTPVSMIIGLLVIAFYLFDSSVIKKITSACVSFALMAVIDLIVWNFLPFPEFYSKNETFGSLLTSLISLIVILSLEYFFQFNKDIQLPLNNYINIILLFACSIVLCEIISVLGSEKPMTATCGLLIVCSINIFTLFQYGRITKIYQNLLEQKYTEQRINMYENQFEIINKSQQNLTSLMHDFKKHLRLINGYIHADELQSAVSYINQLDVELDVPKDIIHSDNSEIDCILNYLLSQAEQIGCTINASVKVPERQFMPSFDLNILLSNLLENALDALKKTSTRKLEVYITYNKGILYVNIYNSFNGHVRKHHDSFLTTKPNANMHGYGLQNIQSIVKKYQGESSIRYSDDMFYVNIILCISSEQKEPR